MTELRSEQDRTPNTPPLETSAVDVGASNSPLLPDNRADNEADSAANNVANDVASDMADDAPHDATAARNKDETGEHLQSFPQSPLEMPIEMSVEAPVFGAIAGSTVDEQKEQAPDDELAADNTVVTTSLPGPAERAFSALAALGLLIPLLVVAAQTCLGLDMRDLWFSDEVRHGAAYQALRASGDWLILTLNGLPYPDKPPLYFWFLRLLDEIPALDPPMLFLAAAALCALLFTGSTWLLARGLGYDKKTSLASCLVLCCTFSYLGITHYARMDLLFASCIVLSQVCLFRGWVKESAPFWMIGGFVFAALACLIKGPLGIAFPLITSIIFLIWRGSFRRAGGRDGALGFAIMLVILLAWVFAVMLQPGGTDYLRSMFGRHMIERAVDAWHHKQPWWFYMVNMPLAWLPWTPLMLFLPWERLPVLLKGTVSSRREAPGHGWAWISFVSGFALLSLLSGKVAIYTLPLYPLLAILTAQGLLALPPRRCKIFFLLVALIFGLLGVIFGLFALARLGQDYLPPIMSILPEGFIRPDLFAPTNPALAYFENINGAPYLAIICLVLAWLLGRRTNRTRPGGALLVLTLGMITLAQPLALFTAPSLDKVMSPGPQAAILRDYAAKGYHVIAFSVTTGTYSYHLGGSAATPVDEVNDWADLGKRLAEYPDLAVATRLNRWKEWQEKPELDPQAFRVINTQWIAERQYVVLVRTGSQTTPAAPEQEQKQTAGETPGQTPGEPTGQTPGEPTGKATGQVAGQPEGTNQAPDAGLMPAPNTPAQDAPKQEPAPELAPSTPQDPGQQTSPKQPSEAKPAPPPAQSNEVMSL